jgi:hypothetical protein
MHVSLARGTMARIAYLLLCHRNPEGIVAQARLLAGQGDFVAIHYDAGSSRGDYAALRAGLEGVAGVTFAARRHRCGWGSWSLVAATLETAKTAIAAFPEATHFFLISGDCWPIKPAALIRARLDADGRDRIECADFLTSGWIRTGLVEERLVFRHPFNERTQRRLFYGALWVQRRLGLRRAMPARMRIRVGSQWWCLRRATLERVLAFIRARRDVLRFFRTTWIPDETFFQTLVHHLVPEVEIDRRPPTFLDFTDYGMPVVFHDDHHDMLVRQDHAFARKIAPSAHGLKARLRALYASDAPQPPVASDGHALISFVRRMGREGLRHGAAAWEGGASLEPGHRILVIVAKKWHVAKRLRSAIAAAGTMTALGFLFGEGDAHLPDLGGIAASPARCAAHPLSILRLVADIARSDRIALCLDPASVEILGAILASQAEVKVLLLDCGLSDDYLLGHAARIGIVTDPAAGLARSLLDALRAECAQEIARLRALCGDRLRIWREGAPPAVTAPLLAELLELDDTAAEALARNAHFFED